MSQIYSKDSFDRFGDDLCQLLLSYLSLKDRFRYECLSKQWQRVIYRTQTALICGNPWIKNYLEIVAKKCHHIKHLDILSGSLDNYPGYVMPPPMSAIDLI